MFYRVSLCWDVLSSSPGLWVWGGDPRSTEPSSHHMGPVPSTQLISMLPTLVASPVVSVGCLHWEPPSFLPSPHHVFSLKESLVRPPLQGSSGVGAAPLGGSFCVETCLLSPCYLFSLLSVWTPAYEYLCFGTWGVCLLSLGV